MGVLEIRTLASLDRPRLRELMAGYTSTQRYAIKKQESDMQTVFTLALEMLAQPRSKDYWTCLTEDDFQRYENLLIEGFSIGAYLDGQWVGVALAEPQQWNHLLNVWELHVHPQHRNAGIGRRLIEELVVRACAANLRALAVETQNTNVDAIRFYRSAGFTLEGIDLCYYTNSDLEDDDVAIFMKRKIT